MPSPAGMPRAGARLYLLARRADALFDNAADLRVRGAAAVATLPFEANDIAAQAQALDAAFAAYGGFDAVLVAWGVLPDQAASEASVEQTLASFDTNARSVVACLTLLANAWRG